MPIECIRHADGCAVPTAQQFNGEKKGGYCRLSQTLHALVMQTLNEV